MPHRAALIVPLWALLSPCARAQDLHGFFLAPQDGGPDPLLLQRPTPYEQGEWYVSGLLGIEDSTAFGLTEDPLTGGALDGLLTLDLAAGVALSRRFRSYVAVPLFLATFSEDAPGTGLPGDLRVGVETALIRPPGPTGVGLELMPYAVIPTGPDRLLLGREGPAMGAVASAALTGSRVGVVLEGGLEVAATGLERPLRVGAAVSTRLTARSAVVAEARAELGLLEPLRLEGLVSLRQRTRRGPYWMLGGGVRFDDLEARPSWRLSFGAGFGTRARDDRDGDGLVGVDDACPREPERLNGWQDLDGCPDELADLVVVPTWRGQTLFEADAVATAGEDLVFSRPGPLIVVDRPPGEAWEARAIEGCLAGAGATVLHEGDNRLVVPMEPVRDATLELVVRDEIGRAVPDVRVEWLGSWPEPCAPVGEHRGEGGRILVPVGAGLHDLRVIGPDGSSETLDVRIRRGAWQSRHVTLPSPVQVAVEEPPTPVGVEVPR